MNFGIYLLKMGVCQNGRLTTDAFLTKRGFIKEKKIKGYSLGEYPVSQNEVYVVRLAHHMVCLDQGLVRDLWDCRYKYPYKRMAKTINRQGSSDVTLFYYNKFKKDLLLYI